MTLSFTGRRDAEKGVIKPASWFDAEILEKVPAGRDGRIAVTFPRSLKLQRFYRALIAKVNDATGLYPHPDRLHDWLRVKLGLVDELEFHDGQVTFSLRSTAFEAMDQVEFLAFVHGAIDVLVEEVLQGSIRRSVLIREIETMIGDKLAPDPRSAGKLARAGQNAIDQV